MKGFVRDVDGALTATVDAEEVLLLQSLALQVAELLATVDPNFAEYDPALVRLLPDAYPDDPDASAEFRRFTARELSEGKLRNAGLIIRTLDEVGEDGTLRIDAEQAESWLRALTDIRLTIASRLGITTEDETGNAVDPIMRDVYDWLGFVQNSLVEALSTD